MKKLSPFTPCLCGSKLLKIIVIIFLISYSQNFAALASTSSNITEKDIANNILSSIDMPHQNPRAGASDTSPVRIHDIQGSAHISTLNGQKVIDVPGIVTAVRNNGFYLQDPEPDANAATSEAIFVFTSTPPTIAVGDSLLVSGRVIEFRSGNNNPDNLTITQIVTPTIKVLSSSNSLPKPIVLGNGGRRIPAQVITDDAVNNNVENSSTFDPAKDGIDFYESLEAMRVQVNNPLASSPTNNSGEIFVLADNGEEATGRTNRGGSLITKDDFNPERIQLDDDLLKGSTPNVSVGATLTKAVGILGYNANNYEIALTEPVTVVNNGNLTREITELVPNTDQLTIATFNVENLDPGDGAAKFNGLARAIVNNLKSPDIIVLEEVQDNNGPRNDAVVSAALTYRTLIDAIVRSRGPTYEFRQVNPIDDTNGGEEGGNIRVGFLFNPERVEFVYIVGGNAGTNTKVSNAGGKPRLSVSPGLIDPTNQAFNSSRKPLVGQFIFNGESIFVIGNHFNSKGGDDPLFGPTQPPVLSSQEQRLQQAQIVKNFVGEILEIDPNSNVIVMGDLNDFQFSKAVKLIESAGLTNLVNTLPESERYTYNFQGNAQVLDHILVSQNLARRLDGFDIVHINSEFADQISDHDPSIARFTITK